MSDNCSTCTFFKPTAPTYGFCRRESPVAKVGFPVVPSDEWCGKHESGSIKP
ncbi:hypothetical protein [uncultured Methanolobus sp.]|uniref:hypothetical protein n=1 Tax=uncultured Methanolobus sp. TaxID=218300 RepID=UPI0029C7E98A|nr:hypothetical protein [uncultured Methanolobus sp.]